MRHKAPPAAKNAPASGPRSIQASTFKATCLDLMDEIAARHTEIIVTKHGRPVVRVGPVNAASPSPRGFLRDTLVAATDIVGPDHEIWRGDSADPLDRPTG